MRIKVFALSLLLSFSFSNLYSQDSNPAERNRKIVILGSSVAAGWVTSYQEKYDMHDGYAYRLARHLQPYGWEVVNISIPGFDTRSTIERFDQDVLPLEPGYVVIGLSMSNEGLETKDPDSVFKRYQEGIKTLIGLCIKNDIQPIVGLCYSNDHYTEHQYSYLKKMNRLISTWDVPSINFLGVLDDGHGHFPSGYTFDPDHPDDRGHEEMYYAIVPDMFDALEAGKKVSEISIEISDDLYLNLGKASRYNEAVYIPKDVMHSFTMAFRIAATEKGEIAKIRSYGGNHLLQISEDGMLEYLSQGSKIKSEIMVNDGLSRWIFLSHQYLLGITTLYLADHIVGTINEHLEPLTFSLGDHPHKAAYQNFLIYRGALNQEEVSMITKGRIYKASLELAAPLPDEDAILSAGYKLSNLSISTTHAIIDPDKRKERIELLSNKVQAAAVARENEIKVEHRHAIDLDPEAFDQYVGTYEVAPDDNMLVIKEEHKLYLDDHGRKAEILPEGNDQFFIHYPGDILVIFQRDENGKISGLILSLNGREMPAKKIQE